MTYYDVFVRDRMSGQEVMVGSLLSRREAIDLMQCLQNFNACDLDIYKKDVNIF